MAETVRRARALQGHDGVEPEDEITDPIPPVRVAAPPPRNPYRSTPRWVVKSFVAGAVLVALLGVADLVILLTGHHSPALPSPGRPASAPAAPRTTRPPSTSAGTSSTSTSTSTTTSAPATAGGPQLMSITPPQAGPGTVLTVHGSNLWSPGNGVVLARVDGQATPTDCPSRNTCHVTVPQLPPRTSVVSVTVTTDAGTSNPLAFRYT